MRKNGFTFIEILGVITLLALMSVIVFIVVDDSLKKSKDTLTQAQIENIKSAASMWRTDNIEVIPDNGYYTLTLGELIDSGYIDEVIDPNDNNNYNRNLLINVGINDISVDDIFVKNGYSKLEYIESTGTQYIDTGVIPKSTTKLEMDFQLTSLDYPSGNGWGSAASQEAFLFSYSSTLNMFRVSVSDDWTFVYAPDDFILLNRHNISMESGNQTIDGKNIGISTISNTAVSTQTIYLFSLHAEWSVDPLNFAYQRVYSTKIWDGESLIRNYIPCIRISDNEVGLYDLVNNIFYENSGSGQFVKGEL